MKKRIRLVDSIRPFSAGLGLLGLMTMALIFRLTSLLPSASPTETLTIRNALTVDSMPRNIIEHSTFFAYKSALYLLLRFHQLNLTTVRSLGVICGLVGVIAFFLLMRKWHTRRVALMGTVLFATSSWFLQASRFGTPEAMYLMLPALLYLGVKLEEGTQRLSIVVASVLAVTQLLYLPGMVWLIGASLFWQRKRIIARLREIHSAALVFLSVFTVILLIPLAISLLVSGNFWQDWLGYPSQSQSIIDFLKSILSIPWHIFLRQSLAPEYHIGRLPLLDVATSIFVLLGTYWYFFQRKLDRTKLIIAGLLFGALMTASRGLANQSIMLPFVYILATGGITLMLQQWFTVFPRNPLARSIGLSLVIALVALTSFYHLRRYFVAWPNTPETMQIYSGDSDIIGLNS